MKEKAAHSIAILVAILSLLFIVMVVIWTSNSANDQYTGIHLEKPDIIQSEDEDAEIASEQGKEPTSSKPSDPSPDYMPGNTNQSNGNEELASDGQSSSSEGSDTSDNRTDDQLGESNEQSGLIEDVSERPESQVFDSSDGIEPGHHENELPLDEV